MKGTKMNIVTNAFQMLLSKNTLPWFYENVNLLLQKGKNLAIVQGDTIDVSRILGQRLLLQAKLFLKSENKKVQKVQFIRNRVPVRKVSAKKVTNPKMNSYALQLSRKLNLKSCNKHTKHYSTVHLQNSKISKKPLVAESYHTESVFLTAVNKKRPSPYVSTVRKFSYQSARNSAGLNLSAKPKSSAPKKVAICVAKKKFSHCKKYDYYFKKHGRDRCSGHVQSKNNNSFFNTSETEKFKQIFLNKYKIVSPYNEETTQASRGSEIKKKFKHNAELKNYDLGESVVLTSLIENAKSSNTGNRTKGKDYYTFMEVEDENLNPCINVKQLQANRIVNFKSEHNLNNKFKPGSNNKGKKVGNKAGNSFVTLTQLPKIKSLSSEQVNLNSTKSANSFDYNDSKESSVLCKVNTNNPLKNEEDQLKYSTKVDSRLPLRKISIVEARKDVKTGLVTPSNNIKRIKPFGQNYKPVLLNNTIKVPNNEKSKRFAVSESDKFALSLGFKFGKGNKKKELLTNLQKDMQLLCKTNYQSKLGLNKQSDSVAQNLTSKTANNYFENSDLKYSSSSDIKSKKEKYYNFKLWNETVTAKADRSDVDRGCYVSSSRKYCTENASDIEDNRSTSLNFLHKSIGQTKLNDNQTEIGQKLNNVARTIEQFSIKKKIMAENTVSNENLHGQSIKQQPNKLIEKNHVTQYNSNKPGPSKKIGKHLSEAKIIREHIQSSRGSCTPKYCKTALECKEIYTFKDYILKLCSPKITNDSKQPSNDINLPDKQKNNEYSQSNVKPNDKYSLNKFMNSNKSCNKNYISSNKNAKVCENKAGYSSSMSSNANVESSVERKKKHAELLKQYVNEVCKENSQCQSQNVNNIINGGNSYCLMSVLTTQISKQHPDKAKENLNLMLCTSHNALQNDPGNKSLQKSSRNMEVKLYALKDPSVYDFNNTDSQKYDSMTLVKNAQGVNPMKFTGPDSETLRFYGAVNNFPKLKQRFQERHYSAENTSKEDAETNEKNTHKYAGYYGVQQSRPASNKEENKPIKLRTFFKDMTQSYEDVDFNSNSTCYLDCYPFKTKNPNMDIFSFNQSEMNRYPSMKNLTYNRIIPFHPGPSSINKIKTNQEH